MDDIPWYAEASLRAPGRVYCAGSLAQCVRKWQRLPEIDQSSAYINLAKAFGGRVTLEVRDDGVGPNEEPTSGTGLAAMRASAEERGGEFVIEPNDPMGTLVRWSVPA